MVLIINQIGHTGQYTTTKSLSKEKKFNLFQNFISIVKYSEKKVYLFIFFKLKFHVGSDTLKKRRICVFAYCITSNIVPKLCQTQITFFFVDWLLILLK